jgi:apolipoprotein N-acyltransferase
MSLAFDPFLPLPAILAIGVIALLLIGWAIAKRMRGAALRALALAALVLALANPVANFEDREPVTSVVAIVVDRSPSQMSGDRTARTDAALKALTERIARYPAFESRVIEAVTDPDAQSPSTRLFEALRQASAMFQARALPAR